MTLFKTLIAAALVSMTAVTSASAEPAWPAPWWPDVFEALYPDRDLLNGGKLTPAGRMGLERSGGAASGNPANSAYAEANNAYAEMGSAGPSFRARRYRSYDHATDRFLGHDGRRHPSR